MALNDVQILRGAGQVQRFLVNDRTTSSDTQIFAGEPVKKSGAGENYVKHVATAEPTNAAPMWGIAANNSTETSTVDGYVDVIEVIPGKTVLRAKATTVASLAVGVLQDAVTFTLTGTTYTINESEGDDPNVHGLIIVDYDSAKGTVDFILKGYAQEQTSSY